MKRGTEDRESRLSSKENLLASGSFILENIYAGIDLDDRGHLFPGKDEEAFIIMAGGADLTSAERVDNPGASTFVSSYLPYGVLVSFVKGDPNDEGSELLEYKRAFVPYTAIKLIHSKSYDWDEKYNKP